MHSQVLPREPGLRLVTVGRQLARRTQAITAPLGQARHRRPAPWVNPEADLLTPGRAPEESYRDYTFRKAIWP
ncbi:MAG TPA: hypothetical protein VMB74_15030 [Streptosporangiaceae bacterium]|nr:hypothetical protein [Streptosporangiaceae bacterium]